MCCPRLTAAPGLSQKEAFTETFASLATVQGCAKEVCEGTVAFS